MSEDNKDNIISVGPAGEPIINFTLNPTLNAALTDTAKSLEDAPKELKEALQELETFDTKAFQKYEELEFVVEQDDVVRSGMPVRSSASDKQVEVIPGVMVAQYLIDAAVASTINPLHPDANQTTEDIQKIEREQLRKEKARDELRADINNSAKLVKEMFDRMRNPAKYDAKFVSYDQMPAPLQRVVNAYIAVSEANKELEEAIKGISALQPIKAA